MADVVLDASAVLTILNSEAGAEVVWEQLPGAYLSAVNAAEVAARLVDGGAAAGRPWARQADWITKARPIKMYRPEGR